MKKLLQKRGGWWPVIVMIISPITMAFAGAFNPWQETVVLTLVWIWIGLTTLNTVHTRGVIDEIDRRIAETERRFLS